MPCDCICCGREMSDSYYRVDKIEKYQSEIDKLYDQKPIPKDKIRSLKKLRDKLVDGILFMLETKEYWLRRELLRDRNVPVEWRDGSRFFGKENARASDDEADEMQDDEEAGENEDDVLKYIEYAEIIIMGMAVVLSLLKWC